MLSTEDLRPSSALARWCLSQILRPRGTCRTASAALAALAFTVRPFAIGKVRAMQAVLSITGVAVAFVLICVVVVVISAHNASAHAM